MVDVKKIAVIGAGLMGNGIAQVALMAESGYKVVIVDVKQEFIDAGMKRLKEGLKKSEEKGQLGEGKTADGLLKNLTTSLDLAKAVKDIDFAVEAVIEKMDVKKDVFKTMAKNSPPHAVLATNTSTMSITEIAKDCGRAEKVIGMHFFNPVPLMRLVEIIKGAKSSNEAMDLGVQVAESLPCLKGKRYVAKVLKDRPGFIVNRLNAPVQIYINWVFDQAAEKKIPWEQIDADAEGKMPMGPCELADYVGIDTFAHTGNYYAETLSPDFKPGKVLTQMVKENKLGQKTGKGFFDWSKGRPKIDKSKKAGLFNLEYSMAIMLNEGCRLLEEGVVEGFKVIDDANMAGMNVPGPFGAGKNQFEKWSKILEELATKTKKNYLKPCNMMKTGGFVKMKK